AGVAFAKSEADIGAPQWAQKTDYNEGDLVSFDNGNGPEIYRAKKDIDDSHTTNPASDSSNWAKVSGSPAQDAASLGSDTKIHSAGTDITVRATRVASSFAQADGGAGGLPGSAARMKSVRP